MDAQGRSRHLRLRPARPTRSPGPPGRRRPAGSTISSPISFTSCAAGPMISPSCRRLCAAHQNPLRPGDPRFPSRTGRGCGWGVDQDGDLCADGDRLFAAGHTGGDFETGRTGDQPRHYRVPETPWPDRRSHPRPSARRALRLCDDEDFLRGVRLRLAARPARPRTAQG